MTQDDCIAEHLKHNHFGEENIVVSKQLESFFNLPGSELRRSVNRLRGNGVPICSSDHGYFYAATESELKRTIYQLRSRIKNISRAEKGLSKALECMSSTNQLSLPLDGGEID